MYEMFIHYQPFSGYCEGGKVKNNPEHIITWTPSPVGQIWEGGNQQRKIGLN